MRVLLLAQGVDTGGVSARLAAAFRRHRPGWQVDAVSRAGGFFDYPAGLRWSDPGVDVRALYDAADVVQFQNSFGAYRWLDRNQRKPLVVAQQGTFLRNQPELVNAAAAAAGAHLSVSTIDLLADAPTAFWSPPGFDLEVLAEIREREFEPSRLARGGRLRVAHAPTNRRVKSTDAILGALEGLGGRYSFELDLIEGVTWAECLVRKARADVVVDQLVLGYGLNAVESWAMGLPVVVGYEDPGDVARGEAMWGALPAENTTLAVLADRLDQLLGSASERELAGARGRDHVARFHSEIAVVERMEREFGAVLEAGPSAGSDAFESFVPPVVRPRNPFPDAGLRSSLPHTSAPPGAAPRMRSLRGRTGYRGPVQTYDPDHPGLVLATQP